MARKMSRGQYVVGNTARKIMPVEELQRPLKKQISHTTRRNRESTKHMNLGYVLFLTLSLVVTAICLISYLQLQSQITINTKQISRLESTLNNLKLTNDEDYSRILSSVDLEEVKRIAISELGMRYAKEGQIVNISGEGSDYVRKLVDFQE